MSAGDYWKTTIFVFAILAFLFFTSACGGKYDVGGKVDVSGTVKHEISLDGLNVYFLGECQAKQPGDRCYSLSADDCANCEVGNFLKTVGT